MRWVVSAKAVLVVGSEVLLVRNRRDEWELPGGQPEPGEDLRATVRREVCEETGLDVTVGTVLDAWTFEVVPGSEVIVIAFGCRLSGDHPAEPRVSAEHTEARFHPLSAVDDLALPEGYRRAIHRVGSAG